MNVEKDISMSKLIDKAKKEYDKRTHEQRIDDLWAAFAELKAIAISTGKKTDASQAKVLEKAKANKSYFHTEKVKDKTTQKKYFEVHDAIVEFKKNFKSRSEGNSSLSKAEARKSKEIDRAKSLEKQLVTSREEVAGLYREISLLKARNKNKDNSLMELSHQSLMNEKQSSSNIVNFANIKYISPDQYLKRNGLYRFDDEALRNDAWNRSEQELHKALERDLPTRVYMLIGPVCAGKSYWAKQNDSYWSDRHPVVIDATNLTEFQRMKWFNIINQYVRTNDIHVCAVVFDTPLDVLFSRNNKREPDKKLSDEVIKSKSSTLQWPDLKKEKFNELVVVRHG